MNSAGASSPKPSISAAERSCKGSEACTRGVRVLVEPSFMSEQSDPTARQFLFRYRIRIINDSPVPVTLRWRKWLITDSLGRRHEVDGAGVVGEQPRIEVGEGFQYESYCPLGTPWGTMEGSYRFEIDEGEAFEAAIARFYLVADGHG